MAKILSVDGKFREIIPAEQPMNMIYYSFSNVGKGEIHTKYARGQAYCKHCRKQLGFIDAKSQEARNHICDKLYKHENNLKRLSA